MSRPLVLLPVLLCVAVLAPTKADPVMKELMLDEALENDLDLDRRIINGNHASKHAHPYIVSLEKKFSFLGKTWNVYVHFCGGALIKDQWVLTAAHCLDGKEPSNLRAVLGEHEHNLEIQDEAEDIKRIAEIKLHPAYAGKPTYLNDIALIKLKSKVVQSEAVKIIEMSDNDDAYVNNKCVITGWGRIKSGDPDNLDNLKYPTILQELHITNIPTTECRKWAEGRPLREPGPVTEDHICVQSRSDEKKGAACHGDSGGPMVCGDNHDKLAGITSWGDSDGYCAGTPTVYARVSSYLDWIEKETTDCALE